LLNILIYLIFFHNKTDDSRFIIEGDYIYKKDAKNLSEYSRFNYKTKECVNWVSKTICNEILSSCTKLKPKILILGVALGDMIIHLSNKRFDFIITGVDITDENFDIVKLYSKNTTLIKKDADIFVRDTNERYDYIICDIFESTNMPNFIFSYGFLNNINNILLPSGKFLLNSIGSDKKKTIKLLGDIFNSNNVHTKTNNINTIFIVI